MNISQRLTDDLKQFAHENDMDVFGIADIQIINKYARAGRRPSDLFATARAILIFGCGMADPYTRGWVQNNAGSEFLSLTLLELEIRKSKLRTFLRERGYQSFGGGIVGDGSLHTGIRLANAAESCGLGYIGNNNVLITEKYGPRVNLLYLATDAPLAADKGKVENRCGSCTICQKYCTSGAILGDSFFHARQCESIINCIPNKIHYSKYGSLDCDMCLRMCPQGKFHWEKEELTGTWFEKVNNNRWSCK